MTEPLYALPAAGAVQDALNPGGQGFPRLLRCDLIAGLPVLADADMQVGGLPIIDGGPASGALGLIHDPIIGSNKCVDKYPSEVFNVNTLNKDSAMKRAYTAPVDSVRCEAHADTAAGNEGGRCMHRRKYGALCQQHAARAYPKLVAALREAMHYVDYCANNGGQQADRDHAKFAALLRELGESA